MKDDLKKRLVRVALMLILIGGITAPSVFAESVTVTLKRNTDTKGTRVIARKDFFKYQLLLSVPSTSEYQVDCYCYGGKQSDRCGTVIKQFILASGTSSVRYANSDNYPYARATMYGNKKNNRQYGCWASLRLSNDKNEISY